MAYASLPDVTALNPVRPPFGASTTPNASQVAEHLEETAAVLDGILTARGYVLPVPVTATVARELLSHYNAIGAWSLVENGAPSSPHRDSSAKAWASAQKMLRDGLIAPAGLALDTTQNRPRSGGAPSAMFSRRMEL